MPVKNVESTDEYHNIINANKTSVVLFSADWAEQCQQVLDVMEELDTLLGRKLQFFNIAAENFPEIAVKHQIDSVPTIVFFNKGSAVDRVDGINIALLTEKSKKLASATPKDDEPLEKRLYGLIRTAPIMIFMKGERNAPRCGFSRQLIDILNELNVSYETFDILADNEVREGLKSYSDWPTYPQVYVKGELIGGLDIIKELKATNELEKTLTA